MTTESYVRRRAKQMGYTLLSSGNLLSPRYALAVRDMILFGGVDENGHVQTNACGATLDQLLKHMRDHAAAIREVRRMYQRDGGELPDLFDGRRTAPAVKAIIEKALRA
jgi:hypothetical protein